MNQPCRTALPDFASRALQRTQSAVVAEHWMLRLQLLCVSHAASLMPLLPAGDAHAQLDRPCAQLLCGGLPEACMFLASWLQRQAPDCMSAFQTSMKETVHKAAIAESTLLRVAKQLAAAGWTAQAVGNLACRPQWHDTQWGCVSYDWVARMNPAEPASNASSGSVQVRSASADAAAMAGRLQVAAPAGVAGLSGCWARLLC